MVTVFEQGDIVYLDFDPQSGHEQKGRRPALVVSNNLFNRVSSLTMVCPITHTDRHHPFHIRLDDRTKTDGVIMCDQVRMLDLNSSLHPQIFCLKQWISSVGLLSHPEFPAVTYKAIK